MPSGPRYHNDCASSIHSHYRSTSPHPLAHKPGIHPLSNCGQSFVGAIIHPPPLSTVCDHHPFMPSAINHICGSCLPSVQLSVENHWTVLKPPLATNVSPANLITTHTAPPLTPKLVIQHSVSTPPRLTLFNASVVVSPIVDSRAWIC
jgi:hypothetical protein